MDSVDSTRAEWGGYPWILPDEPSTRCLVAIQGYFGEAPTQSAGAFEIRAETDTDGDGMDDGWETDHFGDLSHDGSAETDGDGETDYREFMAGTDPLTGEAGGGSVGIGCFAGSGPAGGNAMLVLIWIAFATCVVRPAHDALYRSSDLSTV